MSVKLPELKPWMAVVGIAGAAVAYAYLTGDGDVKLSAQIGGEDYGPELVPWGADHGMCPQTWKKTGRHSHRYPAQIGPRVNALMCGQPLDMGMGLTSWMAAPPSEEIT